MKTNNFSQQICPTENLGCVATGQNCCKYDQMIIVDVFRFSLPGGKSSQFFYGALNFLLCWEIANNFSQQICPTENLGWVATGQNCCKYDQMIIVDVFRFSLPGGNHPNFFTVLWIFFFAMIFKLVEEIQCTAKGFA